MANFQKMILLLPLFLLSANAHFTLNYPTTLGFNQNAEDESPCGGATISFTNTTAFHVAGDAISITTLHPQSNMLYRATNDGTGKGNWTVLALIAEYGLGAFCEPSLQVPAAWVGQLGLLQIVQNAGDGVHYQCAAVNFIAGASSSIPSACQNASGNSAAFVSDTTLLPASGTGTPTTSGTGASATTSPPAATSSKASGAEEKAGRVGWWASIAGMLLMAALLL